MHPSNEDHMRIAATLVAAAPFIAASLVAAPLTAQSSGDAAAYVALLSTPLGGLPPIATNTILDEPHNGAAFALRYGHISGDDFSSSFNNFGATAVLPWGTTSTFSLTGGVSRTSFDDGFGNSTSNNTLMLSAGADTRLGDWPLSAARDAAKVHFGVNGELGFAKPSGGTLWAGSVGLPISLVSSSRSRDEMRFVPFVTPGFGFGSVSADDNGGSDSGTRFMIGAGISIYNRSNSVAVNGGLQYVPISGGHTQFGLGLVLGGR
jgi:hypothetical protein